MAVLPRAAAALASAVPLSASSSSSLNRARPPVLPPRWPVLPPPRRAAVRTALPFSRRTRPSPCCPPGAQPYLPPRAEEQRSPPRLVVRLEQQFERMRARREIHAHCPCTARAKVFERPELARPVHVGASAGRPSYPSISTTLMTASSAGGLFLSLNAERSSGGQ